MNIDDKETLHLSRTSRLKIVNNTIVRQFYECTDYHRRDYDWVTSNNQWSKSLLLPDPEETLKAFTLLKLAFNAGQKSEINKFRTLLLMDTKE